MMTDAYRVSEFCQLYGISRPEFKRQVHLGRLRTIKEGRVTYVTHAAVNDWLELRRSEPRLVNEVDTQSGCEIVTAYIDGYALQMKLNPMYPGGILPPEEMARLLYQYDYGSFLEGVERIEKLLLEYESEAKKLCTSSCACLYT